jgi:hypothetical protein
VVLYIGIGVALGIVFPIVYTQYGLALGPHESIIMVMGIGTILIVARMLVSHCINVVYKIGYNEGDSSSDSEDD